MQNLSMSSIGPRSERVVAAADGKMGNPVEGQTGVAAADAAKKCFYVKNGQPILHLTMNPLYIGTNVQGGIGSVGSFRVALYDKDGHNPVVLTSGHLKEGKAIAIALPPMSELAGRAIYIGAAITFLRGEWAEVGWKLDLAGSQPDGSELAIDGSQKEAATRIFPNEVLTPSAIYRFCASE